MCCCFSPPSSLATTKIVTGGEGTTGHHPTPAGPRLPAAVRCVDAAGRRARPTARPRAARRARTRSQLASVAHPS